MDGAQRLRHRVPRDAETNPVPEEETHEPGQIGRFPRTAHPVAPAPQIPHLLSPPAAAPTPPGIPARPHSPPSSWWPPSWTGPRDAGEDQPGARHPREVPLGAPMSQAPLKHSPVSTLPPTRSLTVNSKDKDSGRNYNLERVGTFQLKGQAAFLSAGINTTCGQ